MRKDDITLQPSKYLNDTPIERTLFNAFKWGFVLFYVLFMLVLFFMGDFIEQPRKFNPSAKGGNWMSYISDDTYISDISIPGTHDSASYRRGGIYSLAHCQNLNLENQLKVGVRYFDIRLDKDYKCYVRAACRPSLQSRVNTCYRSLTPSFLIACRSIHLSSHKEIADNL